MDTTETPKRRNKNVPFTYLGIVVPILIIIALVILGTNNKVRNLIQPNSANNQAKVMPSLVPLSKPPSAAHFLTFQGCDIKKEGNQLVEGVRKAGNDIVGTLYGNINEINLQQVPPAANVDLISAKGEQSYNFNVKEEKGLVYDGITQADLKLTDLKRGQTVVASFNCFPKQNNLFKVTKITVVGK